MADASSGPLLETPLHAAHVALGARMVPFAGYDMPVQYSSGIIAEHAQTRSAAGLFDVSHMGQILLEGRDHAHVATALERIVPADILGLPHGRQRYTQFLDGEADLAHLEAALAPEIRVTMARDRALLALQGPAAAAVMAEQAPAAAALPFMGAGPVEFGRVGAVVSRSGYTGEDGFEISLAADDAVTVWTRLLADERVKPIGLGARDSLRLEAGLCLYGHDIDTTTSPIEAGLAWSIQKRRREGGGFPGAERVRRDLTEGPPRRRVGLLPEGRAPVREGAAIKDEAGNVVGVVTSGGFGPTAGRPVAMGYVRAGYAGLGTRLAVDLRGRDVAAEVVSMPFVPHRYHRG
jgi:aminomethyltransferase